MVEKHFKSYFMKRSAAQSVYTLGPEMVEYHTALRALVDKAADDVKKNHLRRLHQLVGSEISPGDYTGKQFAAFQKKGAVTVALSHFCDAASILNRFHAK